ncbi:unnamed protein product [Arabidopsis lyrata]|nr:unnamed protein product [Arabidopsis lyrata]
MAKRFTTQLFVSRLSAYTTDQSLRQLFALFGQIIEVCMLLFLARLIRDQQTQRPKSNPNGGA